MRPLVFTLSAAILGLSITSASAENWPGWRGPRGDGSSLEQGLPIRWDPASNVLWKTTVPGTGHASPIVWGDRVFIASAIEKTEDRVLLAFDSRSGTLLWQQTVVSAPLEKKQGENSFASGTPATDGEKVYVAFLDRDKMAVAAYDFSGQQAWLVRPCAFASPHGFCVSPVLFKDKVLVNGDSREDSCVLALSRTDGRTLWKIPLDRNVLAYSTPFIRCLAGRTQMIHPGNKSVASFDPETGERLWVVEGPSDEFVVTPVYNDRAGLLFVSSSWPARHLLAIKPDGHGDVTKTHIAWRTTQGAPYVPSPISVGNYVLTVSDTGIAHCYEATTGKIFWQERLGKHHASPVSANGLAYFLNDQGVMNVLKPGPEFVRVAQNELGENAYASPAVSDGRIFLRGDKDLICIGTSTPTSQQLPAFPIAEGFGALATGGRNGDTYVVTNLNDSGAGSFRDAVTRRGRTVLFSVGGVIRLKSNVSVASDITIAGQSAPGDGIALYGHSVSFSGSSNIIVRFMRFREGIGGDRGKCSVNLAGGANMIFDHVSIQWGRWDCLGVTQGSHDITFQNCIIGEALDPQRFGALVDSVANVTFSHNLWLHNHSRNPKAKGTIQYINNVVYNWGITGLVGGHSGADHQLDVIGNYFIKGPSSNDRFLGIFTDTDKVFQTGNFADLDRDGSLNGRPVVETDFPDSGGAPTFVKAPFLHPMIPVTVDPAETAYQKVLATAGCSLHREAVDLRLIADLRSLGKIGRIVRDEAEAGGIGELQSGAVPLSTLGDGIPDEWRRAQGLDPKDSNVAKGDHDQDGYTNLEKYLNELAKEPPARRTGDGSKP